MMKLRVFMEALGCATVFLLMAVVIGPALHLNRPFVRKVILEQVNSALGGGDPVRVHLSGLSSLAWYGFTVDSIEVSIKGSGEVVARDVHARLSLMRAALSLVPLPHRPQYPSVHVRELSIGSVSSHWRLAERSTGLNRGSPSKSATWGSLSIDRIAVRRGHLRLDLRPEPQGPRSPLDTTPVVKEEPLSVIDATLDDLVGGGTFDARRLNASVRFHALVDGVAPRTTELQVDAHGTIPTGRGGPEPDLAFALQAAAGGLSAKVTGSVLGDLVVADLSIPRTEAADLQAVFPDMSMVGAPISLDVSVRGRAPELSVGGAMMMGGGSLDLGGTIFAQKPYRASLVLTGRDLNAQAVWRSLPTTTTSFTAQVSGEVPDLASLRHPESWRASLALELQAGRIEGVPTPPASGRLDLVPARTLEASFTVRRLSQDTLRHFIDAPWLGRGPVSLSAIATGRFPDVLVRANVDSTALSVEASGPLHLESPYVADLALSLKPAESRSGAASGRSERGQQRRAPLSPIRVHVAARDGRLSLLARFSEEPEVSASARLVRREDGSLRFAVMVRAESLERVRALARLGLPLSGGAELRIAGRLGAGQIDAGGVLELVDFRSGPYSLRRGRLEARLSGLLADPRVGVELSVIEPRYHDRQVEGIFGSVRGRRRALDVHLSIREGESGVSDCLATAVVEKRRVAIRGLSVRSARHGQVLWASAQELAWEGGSGDASGVVIRGFGAPVVLNAHHLLSQAHLALTATAPSVDVAVLARYLGLAWSVAGTASAEVELDASDPDASLRARFALRRIRAALMDHLDADLSLDLAGDHGTIGGRVDSPDFLRATLHAEPALSGPWSDLGSWRVVRGAMEIAVEQLGLRRMCLLVSCPIAAKNLISAAGEYAKGRIRIERSLRGGRLSPVSLVASTDITDSHGRLLSVRARTEVEVRRGHFYAAGNEPLDLEVRLEPRPLRELPEPIRPITFDGIVGGYARATGTWALPSMSLQVQANAVHNVVGDADVPVIDLDWNATYDGANGLSTVSITHRGMAIARAIGRARIPIQDWIGPTATRSRWTAVVSATLDRFPLRTIPALSNRHLDGEASGSVVLSGLHGVPRAEGTLSITGLRGARTEPLNLQMGISFSATHCVIAGKARGTDSRADVRLQLGCIWRDDAVPALDRSQPVQLEFSSTRLPVAILAPFLGSSAVVDLGGTLDADLRARGLPSSTGRDLQVEGRVALDEGRGVVLPVGREFRHVRMRIRASGRDLHLDEMSGATGAGTFQVKGSAAFLGAIPQAVHAEVHVPRGAAIPITAEGVFYGTAWGDLVLDGSLHDRVFELSARVPTFRLELPSQRTANLQPLEPNAYIAILQPLGPPEPSQEEIPGRPTVGAKLPEIEGVVLRLRLGDDVAIEREDLRLVLTTPERPELPVLSISRRPQEPPLRFFGTIRVVGGRVAVAGKDFAIDGGLVRFEGSKLDNPALDIRARTDTSDGTHVMVQVRGTLQAMKLSLASSPPKPESELIGLLAFGQARPGAVPSRNTGGGPPSPGPAAGQTGAGTAAGAAAGVGAGVLSSTVNQLLRRSSVLPLRTAVYGGSGAAAGASLALSDRAQIEYVHQFGTTQYGQEPSSANQVIVAWQFHPSWDLRTMVGDRGTTSIELLWRRWY